jgi:hypothetical protein
MTDGLRSRRPENGDEVNALETRFADRHHLLTVVEVKSGSPKWGVKKRPKAATDLPQYAAFYPWQLPPFTAI